MPALQVSPIVAALDQPEASLDRETVPRVALSLVEAFAEIPDPRHARGIPRVSQFLALSPVRGSWGHAGDGVVRGSWRVRRTASTAPSPSS